MKYIYTTNYNHTDTMQKTTTKIHIHEKNIFNGKKRVPINSRIGQLGRFGALISKILRNISFCVVYPTKLICHVRIF